MFLYPRKQSLIAANPELTMHIDISKGYHLGQVARAQD